MFSEIAKVRASLFQINGVKKEPLILPEAEGVVTTLTEKVYVPVKEHPDVSILFALLLVIYLIVMFDLCGLTIRALNHDFGEFKLDP